MDTATRTGDFASLALDSAGRPHICYDDRANRRIKYALLTDAGSSIRAVDADGYSQSYSALALDKSGKPHISYQGSNWSLKCATFDATAPVATVSVPTCSTDASAPLTFPVSWSGTDAGTSGLKNYVVQYQTDGTAGDWTNWKMATAAKSALLAGEAGRTYYFRVRARDNAGNVGVWSAVKSTVVP